MNRRTKKAILAAGSTGLAFTIGILIIGLVVFAEAVIGLHWALAALIAGAMLVRGLAVLFGDEGADND